MDNETKQPTPPPAAEMEASAPVDTVDAAKVATTDQLDELKKAAEPSLEEVRRQARIADLNKEQDEERSMLRGAMPAIRGLQPKTLGEMLEVCRLLADSQMVPKDFQKNPGNVLVAVQMGAEVGLGAMQAIQNIAVINGRPSIWGDAMKAIVLAHPDCLGIVEMDEKAIGEAGYAVCTIKRRGAEPYSATFTKEDAEKAGLWTKAGPWQDYPNRMLKMRARSFACRDVFPDALRGLAVAEEQQDVVEVQSEAVVVEDQPGAAGVAGRLKAMAAETKGEQVKPLDLASVINAIETADSVQAIDEIAKLHGTVEQLGEDGCNEASAAAARRVEELAAADTAPATEPDSDPAQQGLDLPEAG